MLKEGCIDIYVSYGGEGELVELWTEEEPAEVETGKMDQKGGNLLICKLAPIQEGREKTKERGRPFQIGR